MKLDPAEMAMILEQAKQEAKNNQLAYTEKKTITWDGNITGKEVIEGLGVKISDNTFDVSKTKRLVLRIVQKDSSNTIEIEQDIDLSTAVFFEESEIGIAGIEDSDDNGALYLFVVSKETDGLTKGVYCYYSNYSEMVISYISLIEYETIHPVPQWAIPPLDALYMNGTDGVRYKLYVDTAGQLQVEVV